MLRRAEEILPFREDAAKIVVRVPGGWVFGQRVSPKGFVGGVNLRALHREQTQARDQHEANGSWEHFPTDRIQTRRDQRERRNEREVLEVVGDSGEDEKIHVEETEHREQIHHEAAESEQCGPSPGSALRSDSGSNLHHRRQ